MKQQLAHVVRFGDLVIRRSGLAVVVSPFGTGVLSYTTSYTTMYFWTDDPTRFDIGRDMHIYDIMQNEIVR